MTASSLLEQGRAGQPITDIEIIDMHAHLGPWGFAIPEVTPESIVRAMDRTGVSKTVAAPMPRMSFEDTRLGNGIVLKGMRAFPDRILGYVYVWPGCAPEVSREVERCADAGFVGLKLHNINGISYAHAGYTPAFEIANERRMPVLLHTWGREEEFNEVRTLVQRHPRISVLVAHSGCTNEAGYCALARECANVYLELATSCGTRGLIDRLIAEAGVHKVVWGSDVCFLNQAQQLGKVLGSHITEEDKISVLSHNARRILDRVQKP